MCIVDDPMLALIMRFVAKRDTFNVSDEAFLKQQLQAISEYVAQFPEEEKTRRAIEWIEKYAVQYRQNWQRKIAMQRLSKTRCPDCPLVKEKFGAQCVIHNQWVSLLEDYTDEKITSHEYVEETLQLLQEHKKKLQVVRTADMS